MKKWTRDEVYNSTLKYFKGDKLATRVWIDKYCLKDSYGNLYELNPNDMHKRMAKNLARIEQKYPNSLYEDEIYNLIKHFKYIVPQGGPMSGIGNDFQINSLSNCFVIGNEYDSYGGIFATDEAQAQLMKRRGGVGHDISHIRYKGSPVNNSALTSTGVIPFMERYSNTTREVAQDGRRGALMISISCHHPDVEEFIDSKLDTEKITGANISVRVTDEFLKAVEKDEEYEQRFPVDSSEPQYTKKVSAKQVWNKIIYNAWKSAEPGVLFWNNIIKFSTPDNYEEFKTVSTNPCMIGSTLVLTNIGWIKFDTLYKNWKKYKDIKIITRDKEGKLFNSELQNVLLTEKNAKIYRLDFANKEFLLVNEKHKLYDKYFNHVEIKNLKGKEIITGLGITQCIAVEELDHFEDVFDLTAVPNYNFFSILHREEQIIEDKIVINNNQFNYFDIIDNDKGQCFAYELIEKSNISVKNYFNQSILSVDCGEIPLSPYDSCRLLVINLFSYILDPFTEKAKFDFPLFKNHVEIAQRLMDDIIDLEIEKIDTIIKKVKKDPEEHAVKRTELDIWKKIKSSAERGRRTGLGITGLGDMLAALNMCYGSNESLKFIEKLFKNKAISEYKSSVNLAKERGIFLAYDVKLEKDDVFLNNLFKIDSELKKEHDKHGRRNISISTISPTGSLSILTQTTSGIEPTFLPYYKRRKKINPGDENQNYDFIDQSGDKWREFNVFHHNFENWFNINWEKLGYKKKSNLRSMSDKEIEKLIKKSPYHKATAQDVDYMAGVKLQGICQKYISQSISKTSNLKSNITEQEVSKLYLSAWKEGCKGFTIYRDGSRTGVLIDKKQKEKRLDFLEHSAPRRSKHLECKVMTFQNNKEQWIGFLGLLDNKPYEIFTGRLEDFPVPGYIEEGTITKVKDNGKGSRYDFNYIDRGNYEQTMKGLNRVFDREVWNYAKMISGHLRHGMPLQYVIKSIDEIKFENDTEFVLSTWKKSVMRILKKYIKDGEKARGETCLNCGGNNLVYEDGCLKCLDCGSGMCG